MRKILVISASILASVGMVSGCATTTETTTAPPSEVVSEEVTGEELVVDVRTPEEYELGHIAGAVNVPLESANFLENMKEFRKDSEIIIYCRSGNRSSQAVKLLEKEGYSNITDLGSMNNASMVLETNIVE